MEEGYSRVAEVEWAMVWNQACVQSIDILWSWASGRMEKALGQKRKYEIVQKVLHLGNVHAQQEILKY